MINMKISLKHHIGHFKIVIIFGRIIYAFFNDEIKSVKKKI